MRIEAWALPSAVEQHDILAQGPTGMVSVPNGKTIAPAEWQLSARTAPLRNGDFTIQIGGGGGIPFGGDSVVTTPRFRFVLGIRWAPRAYPETAAGDECPRGDAAGGCSPAK